MSVTQVPVDVPQVNEITELAGSELPETTKASPTTPWLGETLRLLIVAGIEKAGTVFPVNGSGATSGISVGCTRVTGVINVSAPKAGVTKNIERSVIPTPCAIKDR